jgi:hypothetical protein
VKQGDSHMAQITVERIDNHREVTVKTKRGTWKAKASTLNLALVFLARQLPDECDEEPANGGKPPKGLAKEGHC